jgi:cold shock CspA family protein
VKGTVKFFNEISQYGFLTDSGGADVFFGRVALPYAAKIRKGAIVEFDVSQDRQGRPCAKTVKLISE